MKTGRDILKPYTYWSDKYGSKILFLIDVYINHLEKEIDLTLAEARQERDYYKELWLDDLQESFNQSCCFSEPNQLGYIYDHMCISTWEHAQRELIKHGRIKPEECYRE